jgi:hypothetical protein
MVRWRFISTGGKLKISKPTLAFVALVATLTMSGCASSSNATGAADSVQSQELETPSATPTFEETSSPTPTVAPKPAAVAPATTFVMPNLIGKNLQGSQDLLQSLGSYLMSQEDATSRGRVQLLDRNWKVCSQDPAPGEQVPVETLVTLWNVKNGESCP